MFYLPYSHHDHSNLCVVKYFATHPDTHPDATESDFAATWKSYDAVTKKVCHDILIDSPVSKERTKAKKNEIEPTQDTQSHVASISSSGMIKLTFRHRKDRFGSVWIVVIVVSDYKFTIINNIQSTQSRYARIEKGGLNRLNYSSFPRKISGAIEKIPASSQYFYGRLYSVELRTHSHWKASLLSLPRPLMPLSLFQSSTNRARRKQVR
ncbi:hypothetical protein H2248_006608 [Termitomyces sp. 'cryptogamus']|nr:hypothetical protein H2248_006608 [Termitomyces sp. 'cryptogamus']